jgi:hypothetical protein
MEISELQDICKQVFDQRELTDNAKKLYSDENARLDALEAKLLAALEENKLKSFQSEFGKIETRQRMSVKIPQAENREVFFNYLKEKGQFDALITVNSATLNSWYKQENENAINNKKLFFVPGLELPTATTILVLKKGK